MSDFEATFALTADVAIDTLFGEQFTVTPKATKPGDPNARRVAAPGLIPATFVGVYDETRTKIYPHNDEGHRDTATQRLGSNKPTIDYQTSAVPYPVLKDYEILRIADGSRYTVADIASDGLTRTSIALTAYRSA